MTDPRDFVDIRPIRTDGPPLLPKEFSETMTRCVQRHQQKDDILELLEKAATDASIPGVYISGPAGVGKSVLAYILVQIFKYEKTWLTIYIPDCRNWARKPDHDGQTQAKGVFLDRVLDALSTTEMRTKFNAIYQKLRSPPDLGYELANGDVWTEVASHPTSEIKNKAKILYREVIQTVKRSDTNVLFVCDEINALWGVEEPCYRDEPWNLTRFQPKFLKKGAILITGTTDNDYIGNIPTGLDRHVYPVGAFSDPEFESMRQLDEYEILNDIEKLDAGKWQSIADATGNIPRELRLFVDNANAGKRIKEFLNNDDDEEVPAKKKARKDILLEVDNTIKSWRAKNQQRHKALLDHVLTGQEVAGTTVFKTRLFEACESIFLKGRAAPITNEVLRVPNFVVTAAGMYPTTADAQKVYFQWYFREEQQRMHSSVSSLYRQFISASNGGDRGNKFEDFLSAKLTVRGREHDAKLMYHRLTDSDSQYELPLQVSERVFTSADNPPRNFQHFADDTLLTHRDRNGGETRIDLIHYRKDRVIFIEATVRNYCSTKIPTKDDEKGREQAILGTLEKWLGKDVFRVTVGATAAQDIASAPKELSIEYRATSHTDSPTLPKIYYIVATTCPKTFRPEKARIEKYSWINVCFLEDLIKAKIIPQDDYADILRNQCVN